MDTESQTHPIPPAQRTERAQRGLGNNLLHELITSEPQPSPAYPPHTGTDSVPHGYSPAQVCLNARHTPGSPQPQRDPRSPFTRLLPPPCSTKFSCCRLDRGLGVGGVGAVLSEAFLGAGVGRLAGGLASSCGLPGTRGLAGTWGRPSGLALGTSASAPVVTFGLGLPPSTSLASSVGCCCFGCGGVPGLAPDRPLVPSLAQCSAHTKVPSSGPFL